MRPRSRGRTYAPPTARGLALAPLAPLAVALLLSACTLPAPNPSEGTGGPPQGGPAPQDATDASRLVSTNPTPRDRLRTGGTLTLPVDDLPSQWNALHADGAEADTGYIVSATDPILYDYDAEGTVSARTDYLLRLPTETERDGRQVLTYDLNPRARWNDGTPIDHRSFEALWKVGRDEPRRGGFDPASRAGYANIESVAAGADPHQVIVTFRPGQGFHPATELFTTLLHPQAATVANFNEGYRGANFRPEWRAGPFTLESVDTTGKTIRLVRNPRWWGSSPLLDRIVFKALPESATIPAFANAEIDATRITTRARYAQVQNVADLDVRRSRRLSTTVLVFNTDNPALTDIAVRKALWQAIDREQWNRVRYEGMNWTENPVDSAMFFNFQPQASNNMPVTHDVAAAKATLEAAGFTLGSDGVYAKGHNRVTVPFASFGDGAMDVALGQTLRTQAAEAGIDLRVQNRPVTAFYPAMSNRDFGIAVMSLAATSPFPVASACQAMCSDQPFNLSGAGSPELDERLRSLGRIRDLDEQAARINELEKEWLVFYGQMPMANGPDIWAYRRGVANLGPAAFAGINPHWEDVGWTQDSADR